MLSCSALTARYGPVTALKSLTVAFQPGERVAVFGHNGAGKTTLLKCCIGAHLGVSGEVRFNDAMILPGSVHRNAKLGVGFVPQGHNVFKTLSVEQNLHIAGLVQTQSMVETVYELFPVLRQRRRQIAGTMSGGEQQMVALGMALMTRPQILLLDEPTTGLAPLLVQGVMASLRRINETMSTALVIVEQNIKATLSIVDRAIVMKMGGIVFDGPSAGLLDHEDLWSMF